MPPGPPGIDDDLIRTRCASAEAADYTLYVRRLVTGPDFPGGQAEILRTADSRGILPVGYTRQTLSEHLSGRYRHGPPWSTTEMIIACLPAQVPGERVRAEAAARYEAARQASRQASRRGSPDNAGPDSRVPTSVRSRRRPNAPGPGRHGNPAQGRTPNAPPVTTARPDANQFTGAYRRGPDKGPNHRDIAVDIADLRADCARLTVLVLLGREPGSHPERFAGLSRAVDHGRRSPLGQLSGHIDHTTPLPRRALAQYLCTYAELGRTTITELAIRTGLTATTVADILTARRLPTDAELGDLGAVLGVETMVLWQLASQAQEVRPAPARQAR
ncbi:helix-turn-helix transcriptional regulator [Plantactinospora sp. S1510]|uniref:Helix-turn-helix transcriptional regulator n=1 Tax=Plantactinospora alkalitolerans TaxID=2789879 RepID=A0ABS0HAH6_9ACTN|nr:helix-turn-helix transcriptional regulator [Plantactinospora alkalitolerans]MBF9135102.1 helix-turn-helix transcriptional regulator [Plantactinospora alkalitolerans]